MTLYSFLSERISMKGLIVPPFPPLPPFLEVGTLNPARLRNAISSPSVVWAESPQPK